MKRVPGVLIFVMLISTACSSVQETPSKPVASTAQVTVESAVITAPPGEVLPTDPDVMQHVFSAELLGADGDIAGAASEYLEAALISEDPEIAERATRVAVSAGKWQMAALASDRWAMLDPQSLDAKELAAGSRLREGDYVGAEFQLARVLELTESDQTRGWGIVAALLAAANDQVRANKVLGNLLKGFDSGSNTGALIARSQLAARGGDLEKATEFIDQAILLEPERADLLAWAGRLAVNLGNNTLALTRYRQSWMASPDDRQIALAYAELLKRSNDFVTAQAVLAELPDTPDLRFVRIVFALDAGDQPNAELLYAGFSTATYADTAETAFQAAQSAEILDYPRDAINWYKQVTGEKSLRAVLRRAFLLADLGDIEKARTLLSELREPGDESVTSQSYQAEAQILQDAGRDQEAMRLLNHAMTTNPEDFSLRYARALLAASTGKVELAESDLRQIIAVQPDNAAAINALGYTLADLTERYDEAEQLIREAYELEPEDASIIDSMGWVSYRQGRLREAEEYLREAWKMLRNAEIGAHLGEVLWVSGQEDEARSLWKIAFKLDSENPIILDTLKRFGELP